MTRVKRGNIARKRRKKVLNLAEGFRGSSSKLFRTAQQQTMKALKYSYRDRQQRKREFSSLWVSRVNAATRTYGLSYSVFKHELQKSQIILNRKILSQVALRDQNAFSQLMTLINNG
jgi:large subunit ribosomal protein L20